VIISTPCPNLPGAALVLVTRANDDTLAPTQLLLQLIAGLLRHSQAQADGDIQSGASMSTIAVAVLRLTTSGDTLVASAQALLTNLVTRLPSCNAFLGIRRNALSSWDLVPDPSVANFDHRSELARDIAALIESRVAQDAAASGSHDARRTCAVLASPNS
jgi:hypothetical protein